MSKIINDKKAIKQDIKKCVYFNFPDGTRNHIIAINELKKCKLTNVDLIICRQEYHGILNKYIENCPQLGDYHQLDKLNGVKIQELIVTDFMLYDKDVTFIEKNKIENIMMFIINNRVPYHKTNNKLVNSVFCLKEKKPSKKVYEKITSVGGTKNNNIYVIYDEFFGRTIDVHKIPRGEEKKTMGQYIGMLVETEMAKEKNKRRKNIIVSLSSDNKDKMIDPNCAIIAAKKLQRKFRGDKIIFVDESNYTRKILKQLKPKHRYQIIDNGDLATMMRAIENAHCVITNDNVTLHIAQFYQVEKKFVFLNEKLIEEANKAQNSLFGLPPDKFIINTILEEKCFNNVIDKLTMEKEVKKDYKKAVKEAIVFNRGGKMENKLGDKQERKMRLRGEEMEEQNEGLI